MFSHALTTAVGPTEYQRLALAARYYEHHQFKYTHAPWLVQQKVDHATKPPHVKPIHHHASALNHTFHFAASGEQSFLQMQYDSMRYFDKAIMGRWQTITPCFRDEAELSPLRRLGFMKLELIDFTTPTKENMEAIARLAHQFFLSHISCRIEENDQKNEFGLDIVSDKHGIELGSYGVRKGVVGGFEMAWVYATGLAEPRLAVAIEREKA